MKAIGDSTSKTSERAGVVNDLLNNVVDFCNDNDTMDASSVTHLISILKTTINAFSALDDNVNATNESSELIKSSIKEIYTLVDNINETLNEVQNQ